MRALRALTATAATWRRAAICAVATACALLSGPETSKANDLQAEPTPPNAVLEAPLDKAVALHVSGLIGRIVVSQPDLVEVRQAGANELYVIGRQLGSTNLLVYDRAGSLTQSVDLEVRHDATALRDMLAAALPSHELTVATLGRGLLVSGEVATPAERTLVQSLAEHVAPDAAISRLRVRNEVVQVEVHMVEVTSRALQEVGAALAVGNSSFSASVRDTPIGVSSPQTVGLASGRVRDVTLGARLRALEQEGEARIVAQPMVAIVSGESAALRAGGELPFPVPADRNKVVIEFRPYGAGIRVAPTLQANGFVQIQLEAELSEIDPRNTVTLGGIPVPGLLTRRVSTVVEVRDGETLMLAGLLEQAHEGQSIQPNWLSQVPILRRLIGATRDAGRRRELAIFVTPHIGQEVPRIVAESQATAVASAPGQSSTAPKSPRNSIITRVGRIVAKPGIWAYRLAQRAAGLLS